MTNETNSDDVFVVGGGIVGLSIAWQLSREGRNVTVIDQKQMGKGTSWAGAGILPPANQKNATDPLDQLRGLSHELLPIWAGELTNETGKDVGLRRCGGWYLAESAGEMAAMIGLADYWSDLEIQVERVPLQEIPRREPMLSQWARGEQAIGAWWAPDEYQLRPPQYLKVIQEACRNHSVQLREKCKVTAVREKQSRPQICINGTWHSCEQLVLCGGAWLSQFTHSQGLGNSVIPVRGQMLLLKTQSPLSARVINVGHRYLVCREDGHILVGSCEEEVGFQEGTTPKVIQGLHHFACSIAPEIRSATYVDCWSGLRPMTIDGFPMIGRIPRLDRTYVACGHFRSGLHLSAGTATIIADLLQGRNPPICIDSFRVGKQMVETHRRS